MDPTPSSSSPSSSSSSSFVPSGGDSCTHESLDAAAPATSAPTDAMGAGFAAGDGAEESLEHASDALARLMGAVPSHAEDKTLDAELAKLQEEAAAMEADENVQLRREVASLRELVARKSWAMEVFLRNRKEVDESVAKTQRLVRARIVQLEAGKATLAQALNESQRECERLRAEVARLERAARGDDVLDLSSFLPDSAAPLALPGTAAPVITTPAPPLTAFFPPRSTSGTLVRPSAAPESPSRSVPLTPASSSPATSSSPAPPATLASVAAAVEEGRSPLQAAIAWAEAHPENEGVREHLRRILFWFLQLSDLVRRPRA